MIRFHVSVKIDTALEYLSKGDNLFEPSTPLEVFDCLMRAKGAGHEFYTGCTRPTKEGRCAGHPNV